MSIYVRNRRCHCLRCRTRALIGPGILVTLGVLFLIQEYLGIPFDDTWPVLLIVIGLLMFAARSGSTEGHVQPRWIRGFSDEDSHQPDQPQGGAGPQVKL